ncbi:MAG: hypothetical protein O7C75_17250 [Verrucomicrobia bacterium]|nr:hypothetical protein [Verrucomicrobiota bacterium]
MILLNLSVDRWVPNREKTVQWQQALSDWYWIQGYEAWIKKDKQRLLDDYSIATALYPSNLTYWRLAAQTIAFDLPTWERTEESEQGAKIRERYANEALSFFERSRPYFTEDPDWFLTGGFLAETAAGDRSLAIDYLAGAAAQPEFSYQVGRRYTRLLVENGDLKDAHAFLVSWLADLNQSASEAHQSEIQAWILSLENQLNLLTPTN